MKKITTILMLLVLTCMGATRVVAQDFSMQISENANNRTHITNPANLSAGDVIVLQTADDASKYLAGTTKAGSGNENTYYQLVAGDGGTYKLASYKSIGENAPVYVKAPTSTGQDPIQTTTVGSEAALFSLSTQQTNYIRFTAKVNNTGANTYLNCNTTNNSTKWATGTGGWSYWKVFKTDATLSYKYKLKFNCYLEGANVPFETVTSTEMYADGETVTITEAMLPGFMGKAMTTFDNNSVTINGANPVVNVYYTATTFNYTIVEKNLPEGTTIAIKGEPVNEESVSFNEAVVWEDVVVTFPPSSEKVADIKIIVNGANATITIEAKERWWINFPKDQKYTRTDRFIKNVRIGNTTFPITNDGLNSLAYRDFTDQVLVVPAGATLVPAIGFEGGWMHGFFYVDLNNDGVFHVANPNHITPANTEYNGELLSYGNEGNALNKDKQEMPAFTMPTTPGDYRARFKMDWASTDPGGNPGADPADVSSSNHIIANGGIIVDITLRISAPANVTFVVEDENKKELFRETAPMGIGDKITELPIDYQSPTFYSYSTVDETIEGDQTITFTATLKEDAPFTPSTSFADAVWYNLTFTADNNIPTYKASQNPNVTIPLANADLIQAILGDETTQWAFIGYKTFKVVNKAAGEGLVLGSAKTTGSDNTGIDVLATLQSQGSQVNEAWTVEKTDKISGKNGFFLRNTENHALNKRNGEANISYWTTGVGSGSTFVATIVPSDEEKYNELIALLESYPYGKGMNQYSLIVEEQDYTSQAKTIIEGMKTQGYTPENFTNAKLMIAGSTLNMPKANTFLRIKSVAQNGYVSSKTGEEVQPSLAGGGYATTFTTSGSAEEASTIWFYDGTHLLSYATGRYSTGRMADAVGVAAPVTYTFVAATDVMGKYWVKPANTNYWYGGTPTLDYHSVPVGTPATRFELEEVPTLPVKMNVVGDKSYATFYSPVAISEVEDAEVYVVDQTKPNSVVIEKATTQAIPAGKGVMLVSDQKSTSATLTIGGDADFPTGLNGVTASEQITKSTESTDPYNSKLFLSKKDGKIGFYKIKTTDNVGVTGGFKAYLSNASAEAKEGFEIEFGGVTGIENMENGTLNMENGAVYNLQGQRVNKAQKGVFIQNGKKVVLK